MCGVEESCGESKGSNVVMESKGLAYESTIGYFQMRCRWKVCNGKRNGGLLDLNEMKVCVVQPPYQLDRGG
ncbi:unnamed protein product [Arabidopsis thaliana]|uniref:(thale cress) hypothetical protein n=1 Tax=Arabidopsis thaliana TaxID=3702 RepID=A0A7G2DYA6_ARATH|nr:unnamed protein product [Arabidopsis thaliana]